MNPKSHLIRELKNYGYDVLKQGSKHALWTNGVHTITLSTGNGISSRNEGLFTEG